MEHIELIAKVIGYLATIGGFFLFLWNVWKKVKHVVEGQVCLLRSEITGIYYRHSGAVEPFLREYERKNLDDLYEGYKALGGNHFVDDLYSQMREWRVTT